MNDKALDILGILALFGVIITVMVIFIIDSINDQKKVQKIRFGDYVLPLICSISLIASITFFVFLLIAVEQDIYSIVFESILFLSILILAFISYLQIELIKISQGISITRTKDGFEFAKRKSLKIKIEKQDLTFVEFFYPYSRSPLPSFSLLYLNSGKTIVINSMICSTTVFEEDLKDIPQKEYELKLNRKYRSLIKQAKELNKSLKN